MSEFKPYFTADGSVGLYNEAFNDIYHSAGGALTEAYEKFIYPIDFDLLLKSEKINVLDICYGIGYNTKSFLNFILKKKYNIKNKKYLLSKNYTDKEYTDNIHCNKLNTETIYTDNIFNKISVTAVDNDKFLTFISPFIRTGEKNNIKNQKIDFLNNSIKKYLYNSNPSKNNISEIINFLIFDKLMSQNTEIFTDKEFLDVLNSQEYSKYFIRNLKGCFGYYLSQYHKTDTVKYKLFNLHNIYYQYVSSWYKTRLKALNLDDINLKIYNDDARCVIKHETMLYNLIFLDAFTPSKCPCLWSYEFFKELFRLLAPDGMLLTYSSSAPVRSAMITAGFHIGEIYNSRLNKFNGTIAVKNKELIKYPLSEFDLGLLNTRAGIFYRDDNLSSQNEVIIARREFEVKNSSRMSSSKFIKSFNVTN